MSSDSLTLVRRQLRSFVDAGVFGTLEVHAAHRIVRAVRHDIDIDDSLAVACAVWATQQGHVCFDLDDVSIWRAVRSHDTIDPDAWKERVLTSSLVARPDSWDEPSDPLRPLVAFDHKLYLARQWDDERSVALSMRARLHRPTVSIDSSILDDLFEEADRGGLQYVAVRRSLEAETSIVTGGPGTGKTYTVARMLVAALRNGARRIAVAAPTAKAAVQLRESLAGALSHATLDGDHRAILDGVEPMTIHRLLGHRSGSATRFRHDSHSTLALDLVVIDEMSMVSLPLMARLLEALQPSTRLVLVGDPGQLDSVENGSILRDLVQIDFGTALPMTTLELGRRNAGTRAHSFAESIRQGAERSVIESTVTEEIHDGTLSFIQTAAPLAALEELSGIIDTWRHLAAAAERGDIEAVRREVDAARVLCAHREGPYGVAMWNQALAATMSTTTNRWRVGDIVVKTRNDLGQGLSNGDTGVVMRLEDDSFFVFFHGDSVVTIPVSVDDAVEQAFAVTVHKSQGSEYGTVAVIVPPKTSPLCTRELVYTAMTRAKPSVIVVGTIDDVAHAAATRQVRYSGLPSRLR